MLFRVMGTVTDFGDLAVVLPTAGVALVWLCGGERWQTARWWLASVSGCILTVILLKLALEKGHLGISIAGLDSPSGHTAASTMVYGSIAILLGLEMTGWWRGLMIVLGGIVVAAIAATRFYIGGHTLLEVVAGLSIGAAWAALFFGYGYRREGRVGAHVLALLLPAAGIALATHGLHMPVSRAAAFSLLPPGFAARL